jgi:SAM-dependent methyltransferase
VEREQRLVFGEDAERYDRARPWYPPELIDDVAALVEGDGRAVDAGSGTGRLAVALAERGFAGVAVEPDPAMAAVARRNLASFPTWRVDVAEFEAWPAERADLVTAASAWHWIDPERGRRKTEDILRPGGWLAVVSHDWGEPTDEPLRAALEAIYDRQFPGPSLPSRSMQEPTVAGPPFKEPVRRKYRWSQTYTTEEWIDLLGTWSNHRLLPEQQRRGLFTAIAETIDERGGSYRRDFVMRLWAAQRV